MTAWNQLEDGQILWQILADIDADYFNESLPNFDDNTNRRTSDNWIPRWQNLKHIERAVSTYIREECEQLPVLTKRMIPDLKTGARDGSMMLTAKLTMAVLLASLYSPKSNQRMVKVLTELGNGELIAEAIQDMQALDQRMAALGVDSELTPEPMNSGFRTPNRAVSGAGSVIERDSGLEQEAQLVEANKDRSALKIQLAELRGELDSSRNRVSQLEEELVEARLHLDGHGPERTSSDEVEKLRHDLARDRQYIEGLEADLQNARDIVDSQKRRLERLTNEEGSRQELRDQLQLIKAERDELKQKAKANENLKKKIQTLAQETKTLETLREDYHQARERLQELEAVEERCSALEQVNKENGQTIVQCEQSIFEEKGKRTRVEHDNLLLHKQLEQTRELQFKAEEAKRELEDRIRELETSTHAQRGGSLEDELNQDENADNLDVPPGSATLTERVSMDSIALQQKVDILTTRLRSLETETLKQMQENLGLRSDIMAVKDEESERPFLQQNEKLQAAEAEILDLQRQLREKDLQAAELQNELNKKADVDEDVRNEGLQVENERLLVLQQKTNQRLTELEIGNEEKAGLLRAALLDRDNLTPELLEIMRRELLGRIRSQIERVVEAPRENQPEVLDTEAEDIAKTVMESQARLDYAKRVSETCFSSAEEDPFVVAVESFRERMGGASKSPLKIPCHSKMSSPSKTMGSNVASTSSVSLFNLVSPVCQVARSQSLSDVSRSSTGTGQTTLGRLSHLAQLFGGSGRKRDGVVFSGPVWGFSSVASSVPGWQTAHFHRFSLS